MKQFILVFIALIGFNFGFSQKVVENYSDIKNPKNGKLYFSEKENNLSLFGNGKFNKVYDLGGNIEPPKPPVIDPPLIIIDTLAYIGYWEKPERQLKAMLFSSGYYLIQTDGNYIVPRGINIFERSETKNISGFNIKQLKSGVSGITGLEVPSNFPIKELESKGYVKNQNHEWVKGDVTEPIIPPTVSKITVPVGVIRWDAFGTIKNPLANDYDLFKETTNGMSQNFAAGSLPFFANYVNPYDVTRVFCQPYPETKKVNVILNGDTPDIIQQEINYAKESGISYFLFNFYPDDAPLKYGRQIFVSNNVNRRSVKLAYIAHYLDPPHPLYNQSVNLIGSQMRESYYQRIDGKPILVLDGNLEPEIKQREYQKYIDIKKAYGQGDLYVIYQSQYDSPKDLQREIEDKGYNSHTKYATFGHSDIKPNPFSAILDDEWNWFNESIKTTSVDFTPNITVSFENRTRQFEGCKDYYDWNYTIKATNLEVKSQFSRAAGFIYNNKERIKTLIVYSWNEYGEGGRTVSPQKRLDGSIDRDILDIVRFYIKGY